MRNKKGIRYIFLAGAALVLSFFVSPIVSKEFSAKAAMISGWLWGGSEDADLNPVLGTTDGNETGAGFISMFGPGYAVVLPDNDADGSVTGYAWSENLGWIDFDPQDHCTIGVPTAGQYQAVAPNGCNAPDNTKGGVSRAGGALSGWARIVGMAQAGLTNNSGGWDGWIKMNNVSINADGTLQGYGWNGENTTDPSTKPGNPASNNEANGLGWIDFSGAKIENVQGVLQANPSSGTPVFQPDFRVTLTGTGSTDNNIKYELDCDASDGVTFGDPSRTYQSTTGETYHVFTSGVCSYSSYGIYTATARVTRGSSQVTLTTALRVYNVCNYNLCNESTGYKCQQQTQVIFGAACPTSNCTDTTTPGTCKSKAWKEVAP